MVLAIRPAQARDAAALAEIYAPSVLHRPTSFELRAPDAAEMAARLAKVTTMWPWLVAEEGGEVLATATPARSPCAKPTDGRSR